MKISTIKTSTLRQAYEDSGPKGGEPLMLLHGWPDSPRTWDKILPALHAANFRTIVPYLRGYGPSSFRDPLIGRKHRRTGQPVVFATDMVALADRLGMQRFHFVGHDWGARTGYALSTLFAERLKSHIAISVPFEPGKAQPPKFPQARAFWYQWLLCSNPGEQQFREDPAAFGRAQWNVWSPAGWYSEKEFQQAARSWTNRDFRDVVLHSYRSRWGHAELDPKYTTLQKRFDSTRTIALNTLLIHGQEDHCELLETTDGAEQHFTGPYRRAVIEGVGHFPQREAPETVAKLLLSHVHLAKTRVM